MLNRIRLFQMSLAPMVMKEFAEFHQRDSHHHLYYLLNRNTLNLVLKKPTISIDFLFFQSFYFVVMVNSYNHKILMYEVRDRIRCNQWEDNWD